MTRPAIRVFAPIAAMAGGLLVAASAQAFTIEGGPGADGSASRWQDLDTPKAKAVDPDSRFKRTDDGRTEFKSGNSTFYFGQERSLNDRYSPENLFNPYAREGR